MKLYESVVDHPQTRTTYAHSMIILFCQGSVVSGFYYVYTAHAYSQLTLLSWHTLSYYELIVSS